MESFREPEFLSTQIIEGPLDVHPSKNAIVIHYSVDARVLSEDLQTMGADLKQCRKIINITHLSSSVDIQALADHIVSKVPFIQSNRVPEVEQLLVYLLTRKQNEEILSNSSREIQKQLEDSQKEITEIASMMDVDEYLESLYETLPEKVRGTGLLLQLARNPDNLLELASNESMFLALTRVLRDDWKKSIELATNIIFTFFCFSTFSDFHKMLSQHKIGSLCMTVLEHEFKRYQTLLEDLENKKKDVMMKTSTKRDYEKAKKKVLVVIKKQESLLKVCLYLLLNLAEFPVVEQKMKNKGIILQLVHLLSRGNQELLILVVSFLKKLSIYSDNKDEMVKRGLLEKVIKIIPCENDILINVTLRLLMNLSFDPTLREEMIRLGFVSKLVALLNNETHYIFVLIVLYHISMDEKGRSVLASTECVPVVMKCLLETEEPPAPELLALGINLACHSHNAQIMSQGPGLKLLMKKALNTQDSLLMKLIRNISQHKGELKKLFLDFLENIGEIICSCHDEEFLVEVLGILGNLVVPGLDYDRVMKELNLLPHLLKKLKDPQTKDDILLEVIIIFGTFAMDAACVETMVEANLLQILIDVLKVKQDDDEILLQIIYAFHKILINSPTRSRDAVMKSEAPDYFIELLNDKNKEVSKQCSQVLSIMAEHDVEFNERVKTERFKLYNQQWIEMVTGKTIYEEEEEEDEDEDCIDPYYLHMAAELYSPDLLHELDASGYDSLNGHLSPRGRSTGQSYPLFTSPIMPGYDDEPLEMYGVQEVDELDDVGNVGGVWYDSALMSEVPLSDKHPAFGWIHGTQVSTARPPTRLN